MLAEQGLDLVGALDSLHTQRWIRFVRGNYGHRPEPYHPHENAFGLSQILDAVKLKLINVHVQNPPVTEQALTGYDKARISHYKPRPESHEQGYHRPEKESAQ